jgi:hypothetical protein
VAKLGQQPRQVWEDWREAGLDLGRRQGGQQGAQHVQQGRVGQEAVALEAGAPLDNPAVAPQPLGELAQELLPRHEEATVGQVARCGGARGDDAGDRGDLPALAALLREDARLIMPPYRGGYEGRGTIVRLNALGFDPAFGHRRGVAAGANRHAPVAWYLRRPGAAEHGPLALDALRVEDGRIAEITPFASPELFPAFGLPPTLGP